MAIITRCRMPPEKWCGKLPRRSSGLGMPTIRSSSIARSRASRLVTARWAWIVSTICSSMVRTGLRLVMGSWKIIAMSRPRRSRISRLGGPGQVDVLEADLAALDAAGRPRQQPHHRQVR